MATVRALKMHGGVAKDALGVENLAALKAGLANLARHIANIHKFGVPVVVAVNRFTADTEAELDLVRRAVGDRFGLKVVVCDHWARGGAGAEELAHAVAELARRRRSRSSSRSIPTTSSLWDKTRTIAREIYGADDVVADAAVRAKFRALEAAGFGALPICVAKTQYSFSDDPTRLGAPTGFNVTVEGRAPARRRGLRRRADGRHPHHAGTAAQPRGGAHSRRRRRDRGPVLTDCRRSPHASRRHLGVGASSRISFSAFSARHSAGGIFAAIIAALRLASLARCDARRDADDRGMPERKAQRRLRQPDLERLADLLDPPHALLHVVGRGAVVVVRVGLQPGRQNARVERAADDDADPLLLAERQKARQRLLLEQRVAAREHEHVEVAGAREGLGRLPFVDAGADRLDRRRRRAIRRARDSRPS